MTPASSVTPTSAVTATSALCFTASSKSVIDIEPSQPPYTTHFVTSHVVTSTMLPAIIVGNASMPQSYLLLHVGELMSELNYALGKCKA